MRQRILKHGHDFRADLAADVSMRTKYTAIAAKKICEPCKRSLGNNTRRTADQKRKGYGRRAGSGTMHHIKLFQKMSPFRSLVDPIARKTKYPSAVTHYDDDAVCTKI